MSSEDHARPKLPVDALDQADGAALSVDHAQPHGVPARGRRRPGQRPVRRDPPRHLGQPRSGEMARRILRHVCRIRDDAVAHQERLLRGLDQAVQIREALGFGAAQPIEHAEDDERGQSLRRRRRVVHGPAAQGDSQRRRFHGPVCRKVRRRHRASDSRQLGRAGRPDLAAVEVIQPGMGQALQRIGEPRLPEERPDGRRLSARQELAGKPGHILELRQLRQRVPMLAVRHWKAVTGVMFRVRQQPGERQPPAPAPADFERRVPARDRPGHRVGGERSARRNGLAAAASVHLDARLLAGPPAGHDGRRLPSRLGDQPEVVPPEAVHVRIDHGHGGRNRHGRLDGVSALAQHGQSGLRGQMVRRHDHSAHRSRCL